MHIRSLAGKNICILGYGREGQAMAAALQKYAKGASIVVADKNPHVESGKLKVESIGFQTGPTYLKNLEKFDVIIKSPGIPPEVLLTAHYKLLTTPTQIFLDSIAGSGATVIGITGSKGKSTTASLIYQILNTSKRANEQTSNIFLVGNIGDPAIAHLEQAKLNTFFIQELSSYQLMDLVSSPHIAVITTFFPEHLDYHASVTLSTSSTRCSSLMASHATNGTPLENYLEAKKHITRFQSEKDVVFFNEESKESAEIAREGRGAKIPFSAKDAPVSLDEIHLKGKHNLGNIAAAYKVVLHLGIDAATAIDVIKQFRGLPHRLQSLGVHHGIEWIDDSISTTPESAIAALDALGDSVKTMILGGQDRGYDFAPLIGQLKTSSVQTVILMPDSGKTIQAAMQKAKVPIECIEAETMEEAVRAARHGARSYANNSQFSILNSQFPLVLLSPAAPSFGHFKNFEDRGEQFKNGIDNLKTSKPVNQ